VRDVAERVRQRKGKGKPAAAPEIRVALPPALPGELLLVVLDELLTREGQIPIEDADDPRAGWNLQVPRAERERVAAMIRQHRGAAEPVPAAA
jgi:hypothetical protein